MTCDEAINHLSNLRLLKKVYIRLLNDPYKSVFRDQELIKLINMTDEEIGDILDKMQDMELVEGSYRNLTEEEKLLKICGGPRYERRKKVRRG